MSSTPVAVLPQHMSAENISLKPLVSRVAASKICAEYRM
jgi:hypothetical protein